MSKGIFPRFTGKPNPVLYPSTNQSSNPEIGKALMSVAGASEEAPLLAGKRVRVTIDFGSTLAQKSTDVSVAVPSAVLGDQVLVSAVTPPAINTDYSGFVSATGVVKARFNNYSGDTINPASGEFIITLIPAPIV